MRQKWKVRRGWIKVHVSADVETRQILGVGITSEEVGDSRMFEPLVEQSMSVGNLILVTIYSRGMACLVLYIK